MDSSINEVSARISDLDTSLLQQILAPTATIYRITLPALSALINVETDTLEAIMRRVNAYIFNNSLAQLQQALHIQDQPLHYSAVVVHLMKHIRIIL